MLNITISKNYQNPFLNIHSHLTFKVYFLIYIILSAWIKLLELGLHSSIADHNCSLISKPFTSKVFNQGRGLEINLQGKEDLKRVLDII